MTALDNLSAGKEKRPLLSHSPILIQSERHSPRGHDFVLWLCENGQYATY